jgi:hypothetical protein
MKKDAEGSFFFSDLRHNARICLEDLMKTMKYLSRYSQWRFDVVTS